MLHLQNMKEKLNVFFTKVVLEENISFFTFNLFDL